MVQMYAIVGQLLCIDTILNQSISAIVEDIAYLAHVLEIVKQEATALPLLIPLQSDVIQHLFVTIEKKINLLLGQSDDSLISSR
jgi:c-di-GMP-related signal transduction protein